MVPRENQRWASPLYLDHQLPTLDRDFDGDMSLNYTAQSIKHSLRILLIAASALSAMGQNRSGEQSFVITVSPDSQVARTGSDVVITVRFENRSRQELDFSANISDNTGVDPNYTYDVRDSRGNLVPRRVYPHPELATGHAVLRKVAPGESVSDTEPIGRLSDMSKPGKYSIQVLRHVPDGKRGQVVRSNKITVTVIP